jgi:hypothetical protein
MNCYGHERLTTPHIDRFAQQGTPLRVLSAPTFPPRPDMARC